eukprot:jgi/Ulvmu1/10870/UM007_0046.1
MMESSKAGRLQSLSRSGTARPDGTAYASAFRSKIDANLQNKLASASCGSVANKLSPVPHICIACDGQSKHDYLMDRILSVTFGKHSNFWSGNRLIVTKGTEMAMEMYTKAKAQNIPCGHIDDAMTEAEADQLYNRLRKTEVDVTYDRQPYMAIIVSRSCLAKLWPVLLDCIVTCDSTDDRVDLRSATDICNSEAARHHGVKAVIHLCDRKSATHLFRGGEIMNGQHVKCLTDVEGHSVLMTCSTTK